MTERFHASHDGFELIGLRNEYVEIIVAPALGGKIVSLKDQRSGREWMWHPGTDLKLFANKPGDTFERSTMTGADECFPSVAACRVNGEMIPDHGEVWTTTCQVDECGTEIRTFCSLDCLPLHFHRTIRLRKNWVEFFYQLRNDSDSPQHYLWAFHPLLRIMPGDCLELDASAVRVETTSWKEDQRGDRWNWPVPRADIDLVKMELGPDAAYAKVFVETGPRGNAAIANSQRGEKITFYFDRSNISAIGIWLTRGGWNGYHHVAIEPTNAAADSLADAIAENRCVPIPPKDLAALYFRIILGS